jgi:hypothetical protein
MMRQSWAIAVVLILLAFSASRAQAQTESRVNRWVVANLPLGVTIQSSTPAQLAAAVKAAILAHPKQAKAIVAHVFSQFTAADQAKALAVIDAIVSTVPADEVAALVALAIGSLSAAVDPQTGQSAQTALASAITQEAIADDPALSSAILAAIGAAPPAASAANQLLGPGGVTNPANFANTTGPVTSPP